MSTSAPQLTSNSQESESITMNIKLEKIKLKADLSRMVSCFQAADPDNKKKYMDSIIEIKTTMTDLLCEESRLAAEEGDRSTLDGIIKEMDEVDKRVSQLLLNERSKIENSNTVRRDCLKPIELPKWDGDSSYLDFINVFDSLNRDIRESETVKFIRLRDCLSSAPLKMIEHLNANDRAYSMARSILDDHYGGVSREIRRRIQEAHAWPSVSQGNSSQLMSFRHFIQSLVSSLQSVAPEQLQDGSLYEILITKLPDARRASFVRWVLDSSRDLSVLSLNSWLKRESRVESELVPFGMSPPQSQVHNQHVHKPPLGNSNGRRVSKTYHTSAPASSSSSCPLCSESHGLTSCSKFRALSVEDRWKFVKSKALCFVCLRSGHRALHCMNKQRKCNENGCSSNHHSLLHQSNQQSPRNFHCSKDEERFSLRTLPVVVVSNGRRLVVNAVLDDGSNETFVSEQVANHLGLHKRAKLLEVKTLNGGTTTIRSSDVTLRVCSLRSKFSVLVSARTCPGPVLGNYKAIDWSELKLKFDHLTDLDFVKPVKGGRIDVLIGVNHANLHRSLEEVSRHSEAPGPVARLTPLGWTCVGQTDLSTRVPRSHIVRTNASLAELWEIEPPTQEALSHTVMRPEERKVLDDTKSSISFKNDRYEIAVPWKADPTTLPFNLKTAEVRLKSTLRKLSNDPKLKAEYSRIIRDYESNGIIQSVPIEEYEVNYMPHHPVVRENKTTTKVRIVFDGSCRTNGVALNDIIHSGPNLQPHLVDVLTRFRLHKYAISCDVSQMFLQIALKPDDRRYFRFLWVNDENKVQAFEFLRVPFGQTAAPFQAMLVARYNAETHKDSLPRAAQTILESTYMDDCLDSVGSVEELRQLRSDLDALWSKAGMKTHKWISNHPELDPDCSDLPIHSSEVSKMLGVMWKPTSDALHISIDLPDVPNSLTKRDVWRYTASLFDPLGLISPVIITARILAQLASVDVQDWDDALPVGLNEDFIQWIRSLVGVRDLHFPRFLNYQQESSELLAFCDASRMAYGAVVYLKTANQNGTSSINLIMSKAKVMPKTALSIPTAELTAAVLVVRLVHICLRTIHTTNITYFSDSSDVLWWIQGRGSKYKPYVEHRIGEIQLNSSVEQWVHVRSEDNPADLCSRGIPPEKLKNSIWLEGPEWLKSPRETWPITPATHLAFKQPPEIRKTTRVNTVHTDSNDSSPFAIIDIYSDYSKIVRVLALCRRFVSNCRSAVENRSRSIDKNDLRSAEMILIRHVQQTCFTDELQTLSRGHELTTNNKLKRLKPFIDSEGVMRVGGRLHYAQCLPYDTIHPMIIPARHDLTSKLIRSLHLQHRHRLGTSQLLCLVNNRFWIVGGRPAVREVLASCVHCQKLFKSPSEPPMAPLNDTRFDMERAFFHTGVDLVGPIKVKVTGRRANEKRYIVLFTCHTIRAVHFQVVYDQSCDAFIGAWRRFIARHNHPSTVTSDNGGNFKAAAPMICRDISAGLIWRFNPPAAPHFGGIHESLVKSLKRAIVATTKDVIVTDPELLTMLAEIESDMNNRPLTYLSTDSEDLAPLTPNHFIMGAQFLPVDNSNSDSNLSKRWKFVSDLVRQNWQRFLSEFLLNINKVANSSNKGDIENMELGDIVLTLVPGTPRGTWPLGVVVGIHPGRDGKVRVATVRLADRSILKRPLVKLVKISLDV